MIQAPNVMTRRQLVLAGLTLPLSRTAGALDHWPRFRGPQGRGLSPDDPGLPQTWSETENVVWKSKVPGLGWSSPVVWGDRVFLASARSSAAGEAIRSGDWQDTRGPSHPHRWCFVSIFHDFTFRISIDADRMAT